MRLTPIAILLLACTTAPEATDTAGADPEDTGDTDTGTPPDADTPEEAFAVTLDEAFTGDLHGNDVDWLRISGSAGQQFRIQVVNEDEDVTTTSMDTVIEVYDSAMTRIAWEDDHPVGDVAVYDTVCFGFFPADGDYFIKVQDRITFEGGTADLSRTEYTVTVLSPSSVPDEPDSLLSTGKEVSVDTPNSWFAIPVASETAGDVDYVKLTLPDVDADLYVAAAEHIESSAYQPRVTLYNADATAVMEAPTVRPSDGRAYLAAPGTTYLLGVDDAGGASGPSVGAWLFVAVSEPGYGNPRETEPNDDQGTADVLPLDDQNPDAGFWYAGFAQGRIDPDGDEDWYSFQSTDDAYIKVAFGAAIYGSLLDAEVQVLDGADTVVAEDRYDGLEDPSAASAMKLPAGNYRVRVRGIDDGPPGGEGSYYRLAVHVSSVAL